LRNTFEKRTLQILFISGIIAFINSIRKPPLKDWLLVFLLKGYIASILDTLAVKKGYIKYPKKFFELFDISAIFSYLIFPIFCVYFNQVTRKSSILGIIGKSILFSAPSALAEWWLEKNTKLITYKKTWTVTHSFASIAFTFLLVRFLMIIIRKTAEKQMR
jgi:hypothetical protein